MIRITDIVLLLTAASFSSGLTLPDITTFIVNGTRAESGQFPHVVSIRVGGEHNCGGAIINNRWILTAAHCAKNFDLDLLTVVAGSVTLEGDGDEYSLEHAIAHPNFDKHANTNDIAVFKVDRDIELTEGRVETIPMSSENEVVPDDAEIVIAGWGFTHYPSSLASKHLLYTNVFVVGEQDCQNRWSSKVLIKSQHLCVFNKDHTGTCNGDSGGPYVYEGKVVGVHVLGDYCQLKKPSIATRVSEYLPWIQEQIRIFN